MPEKIVSLHTASIYIPYTLSIVKNSELYEIKLNYVYLIYHRMISFNDK